MEGTPSVADTFYLKIVVDVFVNVLGFPVLADKSSIRPRWSFPSWTIRA